MRRPSHLTHLVTVVLVLVLSKVSTTQAQKDKRLPGSSSSKRAPYACFYGECAAITTPQNTGSLEPCLKSAFPDTSAKKVVLPGSSTFAQAALMVNTRFKRKPAAVVYAHQASDVQAAVKCAYQNRVRVAVAGGRHSYGGWSVVDDFLVVDTSNMTQVKVVGKQSKVITVQVGPGNTNALLISQLHKQGYSAAGTIVGQCPSVGVSGFMLGGGQGDLSRMFGLACDQLLELELVTYTGDVVVANSHKNKDLLWASCGGGGGLGVITQWTVKAHDLGTEPLSKIQILFNNRSTIPAMLKVQEFIMSEKTDLRFSGGSAAPGNLFVYFVGPLDVGMRLLKDGGLLNPSWLDEAVPSEAFQSRAHLNQSPLFLNISSITYMPTVGVYASTYANYYEAIMQSECGWVAGKSFTYYGPAATKYGFGPETTCMSVDTLNRFKALAVERGTPINSGVSDIWRVYGMINACRLLPPLNKTVWEALLSIWDDPRCSGMRFDSQREFAKELQRNSDTTYFCFALKNAVPKPQWNHLLGGAVAKVAPSATAYPWRNAISPLCVDSGFPDGAFEADGVTLKKTFDFVPPGGKTSFVVSPVALLKAIGAVQGAFHKVLQDSLGENMARPAYYNYQTEQVHDYATAYWGPNYKKLQEIKSKWDPEGVFSKPFTVQPAKV